MDNDISLLEQIISLLDLSESIDGSKKMISITAEKTWQTEITVIVNGRKYKEPTLLYAIKNALKAELKRAENNPKYECIYAIYNKQGALMILTPSHNKALQIANNVGTRIVTYSTTSYIYNT